MNAFAKPNADRPQHTVTLPGQQRRGPGADRAARVGAARGPHAARPVHAAGASGNRLSAKDDEARAGRCSRRPAAPPATSAASGPSAPRTSCRRRPATEIFTETAPAATFGTPIGAQYLNRSCATSARSTSACRAAQPARREHRRAPRRPPPTVNAAGVAGPAPDALGQDYNGDGKGVGYNVPSLLGHQRAAALLPQRRLRDARLRGRQREAPHGERQAARPARERARPRPRRRVPEVDRRDHAAAVGRPVQSERRAAGALLWRVRGARRRRDGRVLCAGRDLLRPGVPGTPRCRGRRDVADADRACEGPRGGAAGARGRRRTRVRALACRLHLHARPGGPS